MRVRIHHVVLDPDVPGIRLPHCKLGHDLPVRGFLHQLARCQHHDHVVVRMSVPAGLGTGGEAPLRHDRAVGFDEEIGDSLRAGVGSHST